MAITINSNISSLNAQREFAKTQKSLATSFERLSSGVRINSAADDAAGLAVAEKMSANIRSMRQASRNTMDGTSMLQTADAGLETTQSNLVRMRELAVQSANGTLSDQDRSLINTEMQQLKSEIDRVGSTTEFNGKALLSGGAGVNVQVGPNAGDALTTPSVDATASGLQIAGVDVGTQGGALSSLAAIDSAIGSVSGARANIGAMANRFEVVGSNLSQSVNNVLESQSRIRDTNIAEESAARTRAAILSQSGVSVMAQANQGPALALRLLR